MLAKFKVGDLLRIGEQHIFITNICYGEVHSYYEYYFIDHPQNLTSTGIPVIDKHFTLVRKDDKIQDR